MTFFQQILEGESGPQAQFGVPPDFQEVTTIFSKEYVDPNGPFLSPSFLPLVQVSLTPAFLVMTMLCSCVTIFHMFLQSCSTCLVSKFSALE